jgi:hypothetical protein
LDQDLEIGAVTRLTTTLINRKPDVAYKTTTNGKYFLTNPHGKFYRLLQKIPIDDGIFTI